MPDRTPAVTPGDGVGASTVLAFLAIASLADVSDTVKLAAVICGALVAAITVKGHADLRIARNGKAIIEQLKGE